MAGEITTKAVVDYADVVRRVIREVGYTDDQHGICADTCAVMLVLDRQSPDIAMGVNEDQAKGKEIGAGDQGLMFGYACNDTPELMPLPIALAHRILNRLTAARFANEVVWLRPDSKSQVTVEFQGHKPVRIDTVVVSTQHSPDVTQAQIREYVIDKIVRPVLPAELVNGSVTYHINPTGRFVVGGPHGDCGLTGRKIIVDNLRRLGTAWRRGVQRQGSHEGGSQRRLHGPARGQEYRSGRTGQSLRGATGLRHRRLRARQRAGRYRRDRQASGRAALRRGSGVLPADGPAESSSI